MSSSVTQAEEIGAGGNGKLEMPRFLKKNGFKVLKFDLNT